MANFDFESEKDNLTLLFVPNVVDATTLYGFINEDNAYRYVTEHSIVDYEIYRATLLQRGFEKK